MGIVLLGLPEVCRAARVLLPGCETRCFSDQEGMIPDLVREKPEAVFVLLDNAAGMEGAMAVRRLYESLPVAWLSGDLGFAPQAFRMGVNYFGTLPPTREKLEEAAKRCGLTI